MESNVQAFEPTLLSHGYAASDVAALNRDCVHEVSMNLDINTASIITLMAGDTTLLQLTSVESRYFQRAITVCAHKRRY